MNGQSSSRRAPLAPDLAPFVDAAHQALAARARHRRELSFQSVQATVLHAVPRPLRRQLLAALRAKPLPQPLPFDYLDRPDCPAVLRGDLRPLAQLALFGLPGQGMAWRDKHRDDVFQRLSSQIMTSAVDPVSLQSIASRALSHPDVVADPLLSARLRAFIAQREGALRTERHTPAEEYEAQSHSSKLQHGFRAHSGHYPTKDELLDTFSRSQREFEAALAQFEEPRAQRVLDRMRTLRQKYPVHIPQDDLQRAEEQYDRLLKRAGAYRRQIRELCERGATAARTGDDQTSAWVIRRLQAIHRLLPMLLTEDELTAHVASIRSSSDAHDEEETARELAQRKRDVVKHIKNLAGIVHRFQQIAAKCAPTDAVYQRAEANYRQALDEIRKMDTDWLSGLVIELEMLLDDLDDPDGQKQGQLDQFVNNVRDALNRLCLEIRAFQKSRRPVQRPSPPGPSPQSA